MKEAKEGEKEGKEGETEEEKAEKKKAETGAAPGEDGADFVQVSLPIFSTKFQNVPRIRIRYIISARISKSSFALKLSIFFTFFSLSSICMCSVLNLKRCKINR
jgi:hypothetical protein